MSFASLFFVLVYFVISTRVSFIGAMIDSRSIPNLFFMTGKRDFPYANGSAYSRNILKAFAIPCVSISGSNKSVMFLNVALDPIRSRTFMCGEIKTSNFFEYSFGNSSICFFDDFIILLMKPVFASTASCTLLFSIIAFDILFNFVMEFL